MLSQPTKATVIRVEERRFRVVPVVLDHGSPKKGQTVVHEKRNLPKEEDVGEWANVDDNVPAEIEGCKVDIKDLLKKPQESKASPEKSSVEEKKESEYYTHFLSVPLNTKGFQDQVKKLHLDIYQTFQDKYKDFLQSKDKVHMTLIMLKLDSQEKKDKVAQIKKQIEREIFNVLDDQKLFLSFGEMRSFKVNGNGPSRVIYASLKENQGLKLLKDIVHLTVALLIDAGVFTPKDLGRMHIKYNNNTKKYENEVPHVTILKNSDDSKLSPKEMDQFLSTFKKFSWSDVSIDHLDISTITQFDEDGYYKPLHRFYLK